MAKSNMLNSELLGLMAQSIAFIIALVLIWRSVLLPIRMLSERMRIFAKERKEINVTKKRNVLFENEITDIENAFHKMTMDIHQYVHDN